MTLYFGELLPYSLTLLKALWLSFYITLAAMLVGGTAGVLLYLGRTGPSRALRILSVAYIEIFRNTPLLVQLYLIYFGLPVIGINFMPFAAALLALTLNNSAYTAEIYRGGFESVPKGLREAGAALGMSRSQVFLYVIFVPALRAVFPALTNQLILLFLASSIASIISLPELMNTILNINSQTYLTIEIFLVGGVLYFLASTVLARAAGFAEKRLFNWRGSI